MMHASLLIVGLALTQTAPPASVAPSVPTPKKPGVVVERVESTVAGIVAQGTEIRRLAEGQLFTEGPACDAAGVLYWTDIPRNELMRLAPDGKPEVALGDIRFPENPSNCYLGGVNGNTLFVTAVRGVYAVDLERHTAKTRVAKP